MLDIIRDLQNYSFIVIVLLAGGSLEILEYFNLNRILNIIDAICLKFI